MPNNENGETLLQPAAAASAEAAPGIQRERAAAGPVSTGLETATALLLSQFPGGGSELHEELSRLTSELERLRVVGEAQSETTSENTSALWQNTAARTAEDGRSALGTIGSVFAPILRNAMGLFPLASGLAGLFRDEDDGERVDPPRFVLPEPVHMDAVMPAAAAANPRGLDNEAAAYGRQGIAAAGSQIVIQVQAMDSRSFLDHSEEIARAVREAMLNSHALNDVVADL